MTTFRTHSAQVHVEGGHVDGPVHAVRTATFSRYSSDHLRQRSWARTMKILLVRQAAEFEVSARQLID